MQQHKRLFTFFFNFILITLILIGSKSAGKVKDKILF